EGRRRPDDGALPDAEGRDLRPPRARAHQLVAVDEGDVVDAAELAVDDRDRGRRARRDAEEAEREAVRRIEVDLGRRLLFEALRDDLEPDRLPAMMRPRIDLD